jgi:hypothetical protein
MPIGLQTQPTVELRFDTDCRRCLDATLLDAFDRNLDLGMPAIAAADGITSSIEYHSCASFYAGMCLQFASMCGRKALEFVMAREDAGATR